MFSNVYSHEAQIKFLKKIAKKKRIPNSLIFSGLEGVGKLLIAKLFTKYLSCTEGAKPDCVCPSCKRIDSYTSPLYKEVHPENNIISIDVIRKFKSECSLAPFEKGYRVFVVNDAHSY